MPKIDLEEQLRRHRNRELTDNERQKVQALENYDERLREAQYEMYARHHPNVVNSFVETLGEQYAAEFPACIGRAGVFGLPSLDYATGGLPPGVIEVYGEQSVGKTTMMASIIAHAQSQGVCVNITPSEDFDPHYFARLGVDLTRLVVINGPLEDLVKVWHETVTQEENQMLVVDSITALRPPAGALYESVKEWKWLVQKFIRDVSEVMHTTNCILMTSQVRTRRSVDPRKMWAGGSDSASARIASSFSTRLELSRENVSEEAYDLVVNVIANELRMPGLILKLPVIKGEGINVDVDILRVAVNLGIVRKRASWYFGPDGEQLGQGESASAASLGPLKQVIIDKIYDVA